MITAWWELEFNHCVGPEFEFTRVERILIAGRAVWFHLGKLFWPANLTFIYPRWQIDSGAWWQYLFPLGGGGLAGRDVGDPASDARPAGGRLVFRRHAVSRVGFLQPVHVPLFARRRPLPVSGKPGDHYVVFGRRGAAAAAPEGWGKVAGAAACLALLAVLAVLTWRQSRMYADAETLFRTTIDRNPECWLAHNNLGKALADRGHTDEAITHFSKSLEIRPDNWEAHSNLGVILAERGQFDEAFAHHRKALESRTDNPVVYANFGVAMARRGQLDEAIAQCRKALEIDPEFAGARQNLEGYLADRERTLTELAGQREMLRARPGTLISSEIRPGGWRPTPMPSSETAERPLSWPNGLLNLPMARDRRFSGRWLPPTPRPDGSPRPCKPGGGPWTLPGNKASCPWPSSFCPRSGCMKPGGHFTSCSRSRLFRRRRGMAPGHAPPP